LEKVKLFEMPDDFPGVVEAEHKGHPAVADVVDQAELNAAPVAYVDDSDLVAIAAAGNIQCAELESALLIGQVEAPQLSAVEVL